MTDISAIKVTAEEDSPDSETLFFPHLLLSGRLTTPSNGLMFLRKSELGGGFAYGTTGSVFIHQEIVRGDIGDIFLMTDKPEDYDHFYQDSRPVEYEEIARLKGEPWMKKFEDRVDRSKQFICIPKVLLQIILLNRADIVKAAETVKDLEAHTEHYPLIELSWEEGGEDQRRAGVQLVSTGEVNDGFDYRLVPLTNGNTYYAPANTLVRFMVVSKQGEQKTGRFKTEETDLMLIATLDRATLERAFGKDHIEEYRHVKNTIKILKQTRLPIGCTIYKVKKADLNFGQITKKSYHDDIKKDADRAFEDSMRASL